MCLAQKSYPRDWFVSRFLISCSIFIHLISKNKSDNYEPQMNFQEEEFGPLKKVGPTKSQLTELLIKGMCDPKANEEVLDKFCTIIPLWTNLLKTKTQKKSDEIANEVERANEIVAVEKLPSEKCNKVLYYFIRMAIQRKEALPWEHLDKHWESTINYFNEHQNDDEQILECDRVEGKTLREIRKEKYESFSSLIYFSLNFCNT